jgi:PhnB protein
MNNIQLNPYLTFNGNCEEAMEFYKTVFGGELTISRFGDFASPEMSTSDDYKDKVMHAMLRTDDLMFMASDGAPGVTVKFGENMSMSLSGPDDEKLSGYFTALSDGGTVTMPLAKQVWGDKFGMVTDKFNLQWMVNVGKTQ